MVSPASKGPLTGAFVVFGCRHETVTVRRHTPATDIDRKVARMKTPKAETVVLHEGASPAPDFEPEEHLEPPCGSAPATSRRELARLWSELLAAAPTDARARRFVAYFRPDAERIFADGQARGN
jgi:hypothetical protein